MDWRLEMLDILRNAGGRVTDDTIRSLVISEQQLGTREIVVLHHTDCGMKGLNNDAFADQLARDLGVSVHGRTFCHFLMLKKVSVRMLKS